MALKRFQITLSDDQMQAFFDEERVVTIATVGPNGRPHLMPLWYVVDKGLIAGGRSASRRRSGTSSGSRRRRSRSRPAATAIRSCAGDARVRRRDPPRPGRRGGHRPRAGVPLRRATGGRRRLRRGEGGVVEQAPKRVGLRFTPTRVVSWDHRKLGGGY